jgi:Zn-dependent protease with chaperone function
MNKADAVINPDINVQVPSSEEPGSRPSPLAFFNGSIEPTRVSAAYTIGLAVVALGMLLLTAAYIGLIGLAAYAGWYHLKHNAGLLTSSGGGWIKLLIYLGPVIAAATLIFFMIKPFFASRGKAASKYSLTPQSDPVLFAFIAKICELVKAPHPTRVDVDCQANASASFRRGLFSLAGNDLTLTIGLPLVQAMTMQEFGGVLAHEFGHFAQGAGMRLTFIIRSINNWFARVVYERDEWDVKLAQTASSIDLRIGILLHLTRFCIWLSRRILWVLMHLGHGLSCFMLRQMEYDADSYEAKVVGGAAFAQTSAKLHNLSAGSSWAFHQMRESWRNRRLPENLPLFINLSVNNLPFDLKQKIDEAHGKRKTRLFDTHPCDADRIRAAEALQQTGVFHCDAPASDLFNDFVGLSKTVTRFYYKDDLELDITEHNLVSQDASIQESQSQAEGQRALASFFFGLSLPYRPLVLETPDAPAAELIENVKTARAGMEASHKEVAHALKQYEEAEELYQRGLNALNQSNQQACGKALVAMEAVIPIISAFEQQAQIRLSSALALLNRPEIASRIADANALQSEAAQHGVIFAGLGRAFGPLQELRRNFEAFATTLQMRSDSSRSQKAEQRINQLSLELEGNIKAIRVQLEGLQYPFPHAREELSIVEFARSDIPATHKLEALFNNCRCHLSRLLPLYQRVLARLTFIATKVEEQI